MTDILEEAKSKLSGGALKKKLGPLPVWAWGLIGGVVVVVGIYIYKKKSAAAASAAVTTTATDPTTTDPGSASGDGSATDPATAYQNGLTDGENLITQPAPALLPSSPTISGGGGGGGSSNFNGSGGGLAGALAAIPATPSITPSVVHAPQAQVSQPVISSTQKTAQKTAIPLSADQKLVLRNQVNNAALTTVLPVVGLTLTGIETSTGMAQNFISDTLKNIGSVASGVGQAAASAVLGKAPAAKKAAPKPAPKQSAASAKAEAKVLSAAKGKAAGKVAI